jgi:diguanylate cyclase (GGDEF)-like protein
MLASHAARPDNPIRVLLVEDDEAAYWHARDLLDAAPHVRFTIDRVRDLQSGLARLAPGTFDVCLLEQALPDGDGLEILRAAPGRGCEAPIIVLTGKGRPDLDLLAMELGAADYLDKTRLDAVLLERTIRFALNRRQQAQRLNRLAQHDELTGLANRSLFNDRLERALAWARRRERIAAVMVLDLNGFKAVNDRLGHVAGDRLLTIIGMRLSSRLRETDTVARLGGDEFALVVEDLAKPEHAGLVARKLLDAVVPPIMIDSRDVTVTASLGVALYPQDGSHGATLLREADRAMYRAKAEGGNLCCFSSEQMERRVQRGALVEADLRRALEDGELVLRYQPQINLDAAATGIGIAGLPHWAHPELGLLGAERFMPLAEDSGMLEALTDWMLQAACAQERAWQAMGFGGLHLAVPLLSRRQLAWSGLARRIQECLHGEGLEAGCLEIELCEDALLSESAIGLRALKELGVRIALDGFGRGATSLRSLQPRILDTLKLAREWHRRPPDQIPADDGLAPGGSGPGAAGLHAEDTGHAAMVGAIIALARDLGLRVVAEAVDDPAQLAFLRRRGCSAVQGLMSRVPLPPQACTAWLRRAMRRTSASSVGGSPGAAELADENLGLASGH